MTVVLVLRLSLEKNPHERDLYKSHCTTTSTILRHRRQNQAARFGLSNILWAVACKYFTSPQSKLIPGFAEEPPALEVSGKIFF